MLDYLPLTPDMLPNLATLYVDTFNAAPWFDRWTPDTAQKRLHQMICVEDFRGLTAWTDGELAGMILGSKEQYFDCEMVNIKEFCVRNSLRGQGIGSKLLAEFERRLLAEGVTKATLFTAKGDQTERFYQKNGYASFDFMVMMGKDF